MPEVEPILHATKRTDYTKMPKSVARPHGDETFTKYGEKINIQDFINAGVESVNIMKHIQDAGGLDRLKAAGLKDEDDTIIDRQMDIVQFNRMAKIIKIGQEKLAKQKQETENSTESENKGE